MYFFERADKLVAISFRDDIPLNYIKSVLLQNIKKQYLLLSFSLA